jgi:hypothetical protein
MSEDQGTKGASRLVLLAPVLVIAFVLTLVLFFAASQPPAAASCNPTGAAVAVDLDSVPKGPVAGFGREQLVNAAHIMLAADDLGLSRRDQQIGVMTAIGESSLNVLDRGDAAGPDSRGLFQQRDSWGPEADRMDPYKSAGLFFQALTKVSNRDSLEPTLVAHKVQANRDPWHYERHWAAAGQIVDALAGIKPSTSTSSPGAQANSSYDLGKVQPQSAALANTVGPMFNIDTVGGYRANDPYPDHPSGLALDFMVPLTATGQATGDALAEHVRENAQTYGVEYIIWSQRIWHSSRPTEGWRQMADRGSATQNHRDHVHVTLLADPTGRTQAACAAGSSIGPVTQTGWTSPSPAPSPAASAPVRAQPPARAAGTREPTSPAAARHRSTPPTLARSSAPAPPPASATGSRSTTARASSAPTAICTPTACTSASETPSPAGSASPTKAPMAPPPGATSTSRSPRTGRRSTPSPC